MTSESLELLEAYYLDRHRPELAASLALTANALRIRVYRVNTQLLASVKACIESARRAAEPARRKGDRRELGKDIR